jgi:hypothetical protein
MSDVRSIRIEGGLFSADILELLTREDVPGQRPQDFGLDAARSLSDDLAARFQDARQLWALFQNRLARLPATDIATAVTRDAWVIPFFSLLDYRLTPNPRRASPDDVPFPVSHRASENNDAPPVHLVGARQELGRVAASERQRISPHALLQEHLNASDALWGIVTNGAVARLLRTSAYLRRQAYVEFDLKTMLEEQRFADFILLFRLIHRSRLPASSGDADACLLEQYYQRALIQGGRVRERLRDSVEACIRILANGFLAHPASGRLRDAITGGAPENGSALNLSKGDMSAAELYRQTLRLVYRFLFLLVSEARGLIGANRLYLDHYGVNRLRRLVDDRRAFTDHDDLWQSLRALWLVLANEEWASHLGVAPLNGDLFTPLTLDACSITNRDLLAAFRHLTYYREEESAPLRRVNYAALDVEELGSVYESLLDYHPVISSTAPGGAGRGLRFDLIAGSERKSTGSYYTPPELVHALMRSTLEPALEERLKGARSAAARERAILALRVLDPACGSGHFLLAAARRLGKELARVRTGEDEPAPERVRDAVRDVVAHCIYGVDKNPLAVELCKVALWLEAHGVGKPLTFLDHRIRCGDSLIGVRDLAVLHAGIPDAAFDPKEGDDRALARSAKQRNATERPGQLAFRFTEGADLSDLSRAARDLDAVPDDTPQAVRLKQQRYKALQQAQQPLRLACDLWTAAFFQRLARGSEVITSAMAAEALEGRGVHGQAAGTATALAEQHRFFHWPLEFPEVFAGAGEPGFDVVPGNPPWERIKLQEQEFFAARDAQVANAPNAAARQRLIARLPETNPTLWQEFANALREAAAVSRFLRSSGRFPLTGTGDINTYAVFAELAAHLLAPRGRAGIIVPTGIATDATTQRFFRDLTGSGRLVSLYDFENRRKLFPAVDSRMKFSLLTMRGAAPRAATPAPARFAPGQDSVEPPAAAMTFAFFCHTVADLNDPERTFTLTPEDFRLLNPNTGTAPIFRTRRDAVVTKAIYRRVPPLVRDDAGDAGNPWGVEFTAMFHMANDSQLFVGMPSPSQPSAPTLWEREESGESNEGAPHLLPLYEAKLIHQFDHRWATYDNGATRNLTDAEKADPSCVITPRYWVRAADVEARLKAKKWTRPWLLGWRDIARVTDARTVIAAVIPRTGVGHTMPLMLPRNAAWIEALPAMFNALVLDFAARQKIGGTHLTFNYLEQLPVLPPAVFAQPCPWAPEMTTGDFVRLRVLELTYTAWDLAPFARDLGYSGPPFRFDPERRLLLRCELDAAFFHLYLPAEADGKWKRAARPWAAADEHDADLAELTAHFPTPRDAVASMLDQFPIVQRKDEAQFGVYRTKETILAIYDSMQMAMRGRG